MNRTKPPKIISLAILMVLSAPAFATAQSVPEPSTLLLMGGGFGAALLISKFRGRK